MNPETQAALYDKVIELYKKHGMPKSQDYSFPHELDMMNKVGLENKLYAIMCQMELYLAKADLGRKKKEDAEKRIEWLRESIKWIERIWSGLLAQNATNMQIRMINFRLEAKIAYQEAELELLRGKLKDKEHDPEFDID